MAYTKISDAVAYANTTYNDFGGIAAMNDGSTATGWSGNGVSGGVVNDYAALRFSAPQTVVKIEVMFYSWAPIIVVGESNGTPASASSGDGIGSNGFRVLRTIDVRTTPNDDMGVPWNRGGGSGAVVPYNTILLTNSTPSTLVGLFTTTSGASVLGVNGGAVDRLRIIEINMFAGDIVIADGENPKPPTTIPALPYTATPANWSKRTEFNLAGDFTFTPDPKTTLMLAVAVGSGAGGRVNRDLNGNLTANNDTQNGSSATISSSNGNVVIAPGGIGATLALVPDFGAGETFENFIRCLDNGARAGTVALQGSGTTYAGAQSLINGTAGASYAIATQKTNSGFGATNKFGASDTIPPDVVVEVDGYTRDPSGSDGFMSNRTAIGNTGSVSLTFNAIAGQTITIGYGRGTSSVYPGPAYIYVNDVLQVTDNAAYLGSKSVAYIVPQDGLITVKHSYTRTANSTATTNLANIQIAGAGQGGSNSGASGRTASVYLPPTTLNIHVPSGGIGVAGGQAVTSAQNGQRGSGGAPGGNGGDGVVIIYEFQGQMPFEKPVVPFALAQFNTALSLERVGFYRTDYATPPDGGVQNVAHKLRPRTKSVIALIVGAGGSRRTAESSATAQPETSISSSKVSHKAGSGFSASGAGAGNGGVYTGTREPILSKDGVAGVGPSQSPGATQSPGITGGYGTANAGGSYVTAGGGSAAYALVLIGASDFDSQTLNLQIAGRQLSTGGGVGGYESGTGGAIFLFETETVFGPQISNITELLLRKEPQTPTQVSQSSQLLLRKEAQTPTNVSQMSELILAKESIDSDLQISYMNVAFVYQYTDPITAISQASELLLMKQGPSGSQISNASELLLMKQGKLDTRISQSTGMIFMAEIASVFYLDFGTLEYPMKNKLYTSIVKRATSVKPGTYIQLEGNLAPDSAMFVNGVNVGRSASVKDSDQISLSAGVVNYWQTTINVYAYYTTNGQVTRELVGLWKVKQPDFTPVPTRAYAAYANYTWIKTMHGFAISKLIPDFVKTNATYVAFVEFLASQAHSAAVSVSAVATKALATVFSNAGAIWAQAHSDSVDTTWEATKALSNTVMINGFDVIKAASKNVIILDGAIKADAISKYATPFDYGIVKTHANEENLFDFELVQTASQFYTSTDYEKVSVSYGDYKYEVNVAAHNGYGTVKTLSEKWNVGHLETSDATFLPIVYTHYFGIFDVAPVTTKAYSVLSGVIGYEKSEIRGTGWYLMPTGEAYIHKAGFGNFTMDQSISSIAYSTPSDRGTEKTGASELGYWDTTAISYPASSSVANYEWVRRIAAINTFEVGITFTSNNMQKVPFTPYRYEQSENGRGKASLYMGFDTTQAATDFTSNFSDVSIIPKFSGYIYNAGVDKTFTCEIYFNGPIKWLIQGG